jgi:hypothetical protein
MIVDKKTEMWVAQAVPATAATTTSNLGNQIPLGTAGIAGLFRDLGVGRPLYAVFVAATNLVSVAGQQTTIQLHLITDAAADMASPAFLASSRAFPVGNGTQGTIVPRGTILWEQALPLEHFNVAYEGFLGASLTTGAQALSATATDRQISAFITDTPPSWKPHADIRGNDPGTPSNSGTIQGNPLP